EVVKYQILKGNYTIVVACGGDGTVNKVASVLVNTNMSLGIFPLGSGNGLARSNAIPMDYIKALKCIENAQIKHIDVAKINQFYFFCTAGIGFDAHIAHLFSSSTKRGFLTYITTTIKAFFGYNPNEYRLIIDAHPYLYKAFLITIANAGQWGNDVYIAPKAVIDDGILNVSILKPFSILRSLNIAIKLFSRKIHTSSALISKSGREIVIEFANELPVHYDGEPILMRNKISINVIPKALQIIS
ncbi:MAG: diacylglycerol kinase family lipid kinase, partial [Bacteroidia bacterium]|nr:diacylglycerol kinase family lipid kinase [Bacteroidia bacterium]